MKYDEGETVHINDEQQYQSQNREHALDHNTAWYWSDEIKGQKMYAMDHRKYHYRPLGVLLLAAFYGLLGVGLLLAPLAALFAGHIWLPGSVGSALLSVGSLLIGVVLCAMLARGLWTLDGRIRTAVMILSGIVMVGFAGELLSGNKLGIAIFGIAFMQMLYLAYPEVRIEFHEDDPAFS
jgi:hypothetical protein